MSTEFNTATAWLLHFTDADPLEVHFFPAATHAEALAAYPAAVAAQPIPQRTGRTATTREVDELGALVESIYAADTEEERQEALDVALADPDAALPCYRAIAVERGPIIPSAVDGDDLRPCGQCANFRGRVCGIAEPGGLVSARRGYEPIRDLPRRCEGFAPGQDDPDQRPGRERWPGLIRKGGK